MRCLLLGSNEIGPKGVAAIVAALPRNPTMARLDLERTGAAFGQVALFRDGERVRLKSGHVVHEGSGRRVPRADGAAQASIDPSQATDGAPSGRDRGSPDHRSRN